MKYRLFIEENFLIDKADSGKLVPFTFNSVQEQYYEDLVREYDIEKKGIGVAVRENILKARREGFSSFILGLFAADDIVQDNPTETDVLSYKDDATATFKRRYRTYLLSYFAKENGCTNEQIAENINVLEEIAPHVLSVDSDEIQLAHNQAHFQCNTASARVGGRGGVRHKLLFSEIAFYPDTEKMLASQMVEATARQVEVTGGWIFCESTENGIGTYQHRMWVDAKLGRIRYKNRFYGAGAFYTPEEIEVIKSEFVDMDSFRREYPMTEDDLFKGSLKSFTDEAELLELTESRTDKELIFFLEMQHENGVDVAETIASTLDQLVKLNPGKALYAAIDEAKDIDATVLAVLRDNRSDLSGGVKGIEIDTTRGDWLADWFEKNTNFYVKRQRFSRATKSLMYSNLMIVIKDKATKVPKWKDGKEWVTSEYKHFFNQMVALQKQTIGEMLVVAHPKGNCKSGGDHNYDECDYHDDYPDTWAMVEDMYVELNGVPVRKKKPTIPTVPNAIVKLLDKPMMARRKYGSGGFE